MIAVEGLAEKYTRRVGRARQYVNCLSAICVPQAVKKFLHPLPEGGAVLRVAKCAVAQVFRAGNYRPSCRGGPSCLRAKTANRT